MRTHGLGLSPEDSDQSAIPYVVGFEEPVVAGLPDPAASTSDATRQPFRLRWIPLKEGGRLPEKSNYAPEADRGHVSGSRMRGWSVDEG